MYLILSYYSSFLKYFIIDTVLSFLVTKYHIDDFCIRSSWQEIDFSWKISFHVCGTAISNIIVHIFTYEKNWYTHLSICRFLISPCNYQWFSNLPNVEWIFGLPNCHIWIGSNLVEMIIFDFKLIQYTIQYIHKNVYLKLYKYWSLCVIFLI